MIQCESKNSNKYNKNIVYVMMVLMYMNYSNLLFVYIKVVTPYRRKLFYHVKL